MKQRNASMGWALKPVADIFNVVGGGTPSTLDHAYWGGELPWISSADIDDWDIRGITPRKWITHEGLSNSATNRVPVGSIIVVTRVGLGKVGLAEQPLSFSQDCQGLIPVEEALLPEFAAWQLKMRVQSFKHTGRGTTIKGVTKRQLLDIPLLLPPIREQMFVVQELQKQFTRLDAARRFLIGSLTRLKAYRRAVTEIALGKERWEGIPLGDLAELGSGATPKRGRSDYYKGGTIPWVTSAKLNDPFVREPTTYITEKALRETSVRLWPKHTLLVAMYGEGQTRGKCSELLIDAATNQACAAIVLRPDAPVMRRFLKLFLLSRYEAHRHLSSGGVQPNLSLRTLKRLTIPVPSRSQQETIVADLERRLSIIDQLEQEARSNVQRADSMRQSILRLAFSGQITRES